RAHLLRWRPRPRAQRRETTPRAGLRAPPRSWTLLAGLFRQPPLRTEELRGGGAGYCWRGRDNDALGNQAEDDGKHGESSEKAAGRAEGEEKPQAVDALVARDHQASEAHHGADPAQRG